VSLSDAEIRHVAMLARLALTDEQVVTLRDELNSILDHIDTIQRLDLEGVVPMSHPIPMLNETREDVPRKGLTQAQALLNAPEAEDGAFRIPRIVGAEEDV
jgi:aspartyl-tRNA(Asn)/glutamyl-tRNA(Gln) amidotransferase subunit C